MSADAAEQLLARAIEDAAAARAALHIPEISDAILGFHAQQAVEKSLKSVLAAEDRAFPFTHDVEGLIELCIASAIALPDEIEERAGLLTPYAVRHRYGGEPPALLTRVDAHRLAEIAVAWAGQALDA